MPGAEYLEALILGVVQGITEFFPVSSSGHVVIFSDLMHQITGREVDPESNLRLNVALHLGTLLSILVVYRDDLWQLLRAPRRCVSIVVATIPVVIVGFTLKDWIETELLSPMVAGCSLLITAVMLIVGQQFARNEYSIDQISTRMALVIGVSQAVALVPGISRSGSTISCGLLVGLRRDAATAFSFFIAIPAICGASVLMMADLFGEEQTTSSLMPLLLGATVAFIVGLFALRGLLHIVVKRGLHWFALYCVIVGTATIAWQVAR